MRVPQAINVSFLSRFVQGLCMAVLFLLAACGGSEPGKAPRSSTDIEETAIASDEHLNHINASSIKTAEINAAELQLASVNGSKVADAVKTIGSNRVSVYRFYNTQTGAHFYTSSEAEKSNILSSLPTFRFEGTAFYASSVEAEGLSPVFRFLNLQTGVHLYTISEDEKAYVSEKLSQFVYEGIAYYASKTEGAGLSPNFRFYLGSKGFHLYTNNPSERDKIIADMPQYRFEGVGYYVLSSLAEQCSSTGTSTVGYSRVLNYCNDQDQPVYFDITECVRDNATGLIWQGHSSEAGSLRSPTERKTNYTDSNFPQKWNATALVFENPTQNDIDSSGNIIGFRNLVNQSSLCGFSNWRIPTKDELSSLTKSGSTPSIDTAWFPYTSPEIYWTSTQEGSGTWAVDFSGGATLFAWRDVVLNTPFSVRLVR